MKKEQGVRGILLSAERYSQLLECERRLRGRGDKAMGDWLPEAVGCFLGMSDIYKVSSVQCLRDDARMVAAEALEALALIHERRAKADAAPESDDMPIQRACDRCGEKRYEADGALCKSACGGRFR